MEGLHERFLVSVRSGNKNREFEVVPNIGHYAILEDDVTVAEIVINESGAHVDGKTLPKDVLNALVEKIQNHINTGLSA
nr:hypothetical protein [uncultured Mucilaginibacter sp.]